MSKKWKLFFIKTILILSCIFGFSSRQPAICAYADEVAEETNGGEGTEEGTESTFFDYMISAVLKGTLVEEGENFLDPYNTLDQTFSLVVDALDDDSDLIQSDFYALFQGFSLTIMIIFWLMNMASRDSLQQFGGNVSLELFVKPFLTLVVALIVMLNIRAFLHFFFAFSQACYEMVKDPDSGNQATAMATTIDDIYHMVGYNKNATKITEKAMNIVACIQLILAFILPYIITIGTTFASLWVVLSRAMNIIVTGLMAPLACADLASGRDSIVNTETFRYIKHFASLCFQSVVIAVVYRVSTLVLSNLVSTDGLVSGTGFGSVMTMAMYYTVLRLAVVGLIVGSANMAKRLFGAS